jgi:hypothetical protein
MLGAKDVVLAGATDAYAIGTVITVKSGGHLYATNAQGAYFGPGAYKVEGATVSITPGTGNFTLLSGTNDDASLATELGSITLPEDKYILNSTAAVQLSFGNAVIGSYVWKITTADAAKLTATNGQVTIGPMAITGVATDGTNYASLVSSATVVVYDVAAGATHDAPLVIDNVIVVLASGDKLKMAAGGEIKLSPTTANTGDTKFAGGGGILLNSTGNKLAVGSAVLAYNATESSADTAVAGKIVGTSSTGDTTAGIASGDGSFGADSPASNKFILVAY